MNALRFAEAVWLNFLERSTQRRRDQLQARADACMDRVEDLKRRLAAIHLRRAIKGLPR